MKKFWEHYSEVKQQTCGGNNIQININQENFSFVHLEGES